MAAPERTNAAAELAAPEALAALRQALRVGELELRAAGVSMRPALQPGDKVRVARRPPRWGDIALVALDDQLLLHRLLRRHGDAWLLRGDARPRPDGWVSERCILGVAVGHVRGASFRRLDTGRARARGLALAPLARLARRAAFALRSVASGMARGR